MEIALKLDPDKADIDAILLGLLDFNRKVVEDPRVECVMLPISDGLTMIRRVS